MKDIDNLFEGKYILSHTSEDVSVSSSLNFIYKEDREIENIKNIAHLSQEMLEKCNFKIIGALPEAESNSFEIALTKYQCYYLGWVDKDQMSDASAFQQILNRTYKIKFWRNFAQPKLIEFNISGIIDTNYKFLEEDSPYYSFRNEAQESYEMHNNVFVSQTLFEEIMKISIGENYANENAYHDIYVLTENSAYLECEKLITQFENKNGSVKKLSQIDYIIEQCDNISDLYGKLSFVAAMILLGISLFSFVGFIRFSIEINKKKMKVLRLLGVTMLDSGNIFSLQTFIITIICTILALLPYMVAISQINVYFQNSLNTSLSVFHISFLIIFLTFIGLFLISLAVTALINICTFHDNNLKIKED